MDDWDQIKPLGGGGGCAMTLDSRVVLQPVPLSARLGWDIDELFFSPSVVKTSRAIINIITIIIINTLGTLNPEG